MSRTRLKSSKEWWNELLGTIQVHTPELCPWIFNQPLAFVSDSQLQGLGDAPLFTSPGGAFGFRDQLQDVMALLTRIPGWRANTSCLRQAVSFRRGMCNTGGIRRVALESAREFPMTSCGFPMSSLICQDYRDASILREVVGFLDAPILERDQHGGFPISRISLERASLFEHCQRAVTRGRTSGPHGLSSDRNRRLE